MMRQRNDIKVLSAETALDLNGDGVTTITGDRSWGCQNRLIP